MAIIVSGVEKSTYTPIEEGTYCALCYGLIDIGYVYSEKFDNVSKKLRVLWELIGAGTDTIDGVEVNKVISKEYTASLNAKGNLRKDLRAWRGREFTDEELERFNLNNVLGAPCQIQIIHNTGNNGSTYANIAAIMSLPKGMPKPAETRTFISWDYAENEIGDAQWDMLPEWLQNAIKETESYQFITTGNTGHLKEHQIKEIEETNAFKKWREKNGDMPVIDGNDEDLPF